MTRLRAILATPVEGQRVDVEGMMGTIRKVLSNADSCDISVDLDNGEKCTLSYPSQGMYLLSAAEAELEDIDKIKDTLALATELTKPNLDSAVYDRVTKIRHSSHTLDDPITICPVGQTPDIGVDIANLKHDLSNALKSRDSFDDASLLRIIRPLIIGIAKFDTCAPPAQTRKKKVNFSAPMKSSTSTKPTPTPTTGYDDDQVTMDNLRSDTVDRHSLVTEYVSDNGNKKRSSTGNGGGFYTLNCDLISLLKSMVRVIELCLLVSSYFLVLIIYIMILG